MTGEMGITSRARATPSLRADTLARIESVWPSILAAVEQHASPIVAAASCGVPSSTFLRWRQAWEAGDERLRPFFERLEVSLAKSELDLIEAIKNPPTDAHGRSDTGRQRGCMFVLERSRRERWAPSIDVRIDVKRTLVRELLEVVRERVSSSAFREVVAALTDIDDAGTTAGVDLPSLPTTTEHA